MKLEAPRPRPVPERDTPLVRGAQELDRVRRRNDRVVVPHQADRRIERADERIARACRRELHRLPGEVAPRQRVDRTAERRGQQLRPQAHPEDRDAARDRAAQPVALLAEDRVPLDVEHGLLAAEGDDAIDRVERRQDVAAPAIDLAQLRSATEQRLPGVSGERPLEVVDDGDDGHDSGLACRGSYNPRWAPLGSTMCVTRPHRWSVTDPSNATPLSRSSRIVASSSSHIR